MIAATMPWGKHRGQHVSNVPAGYLAFVLEECDNVPRHLEDAIRQELAERLGLASAAPRYQPPPPRRGIDPATLRDAVSRWFREQSLRHHPDRGGDELVMQGLNNVHDALRELIARLEAQ